MLIKRNTTLFKKVENYIKWRYNYTRSICMILVDKGGRVWVKTVLSNKDHYPSRLNNLIKVWSLHTECVNLYQMNDIKEQ